MIIDEIYKIEHEAHCRSGMKFSEVHIPDFRFLELQQEAVDRLCFTTETLPTEFVINGMKAIFELNCGNIWVS